MVILSSRVATLNFHGLKSDLLVELGEMVKLSDHWSGQVTETSKRLSLSQAFRNRKDGLFLTLYGIV